MNILFTICGRAGSKGIRNKNIANFLDYPLPYYTLSAIDLFLERNPLVDNDIVVNTDSRELMRLFENNRLRPTWIVQRKKELGQDGTPKIAVIRNSLEEMERRTKKRYDMVVDLDITSPLRKVTDIENIIEKKKNASCDVVFSVVEARRNPYFNMVKRNGEKYERVIASAFHTRQEAPELYDMNASLYAYSPRFLVSGKNIFDGVCQVIKMVDTGVLDLDHVHDLEFMEVIARYLFEKEADFGEVRTNLSEKIKEVK